MVSSRRKSTATRTKFRAGERHAQVQVLQLPDRTPFEVEFPGNILEVGLATDPVGIAIGLEGIVRREFKPLALHAAANPAEHAIHLDRKKATCAAKRETANAPRSSIAPARLESTTVSENTFLAHQTPLVTRAFLLPKTPRSAGCRRKIRLAYAYNGHPCLSTELAARPYSITLRIA